MLLRQSPAQSRQPCGPVVGPRISPALSELETLSPHRPSPPPRAHFSDMYPEESRGSGGVATVDFLEATYDYAAPTPAPTPLYSHSTPGYYSAPLDSHRPPSDGSLQSLGSGPASPLVFVPSSPRLSPFLHPPSHHYLETTSTHVYRWGNTIFLYPHSRRRCLLCACKKLEAFASASQQESLPSLKQISEVGGVLAITWLFGQFCFRVHDYFTGKRIAIQKNQSTSEVCFLIFFYSFCCDSSTMNNIHEEMNYHHRFTVSSLLIWCLLMSKPFCHITVFNRFTHKLSGVLFSPHNVVRNQI